MEQDIMTTSTTPSPEPIDPSVRDRLLTKPELILEDQDLMQALMAANENALGANVVDLRGVAMERLSARLDRLEDTHRSVIAAAYENLAGTNQVHRAILRMLDPDSFEGFLANLSEDVATILRVDAVRLVLESTQEADDPVKRLDHVVTVVTPGSVGRYIDGAQESEGKQVTLRTLNGGQAALYGPRAAEIRSEACLRLNLGEGRLPGMLLLGAYDGEQFGPQQGTDLLSFFAGVFERSMRRWLA